MEQFEDRKSKAREMLLDFLDQFTPPRGVDEDAQATRLNSIADAFARKMPVQGDYEEKVQGVFQSILDTYSSNTWPAQAVFVECMPKWENLGKSAPQSYRPDDKIEHYREKISRSDPLPETVIWGPMAYRAGLEALRPYREASIAAWQKAYRDDAEMKMTSRYGHVVQDFMNKSGFVS